VRVNCPHCGLNIITFIEHESSWLTYTVSIVLLFVLNWAALCVVPVVYPLFKDVVHHCPRCLSVLATRSRVSVPRVTDEIMTFRFGTCVIVLARKYVFVLMVFLTLITGYHSVRSSGVSHSLIDEVVRGEPMVSTWQDFINDCGFKSYLGNPIHVTVAFNENYKNKTISWNGEVHHIEPGFTFFWWSQRGAVFVQMDPPQLPAKRDAPDLVLLYEDGKMPDVGNYKRGASISFEATFVEVGRRGAPHVMAMWQAKPGPPLPPKPEGVVEKLGAAFGSAMHREGRKKAAAGEAAGEAEDLEAGGTKAVPADAVEANADGGAAAPKESGAAEELRP